MGRRMGRADTMSRKKRSRPAGQYGPALGPAAVVASFVTVLAVATLTVWSALAGQLAQPPTDPPTVASLSLSNRHPDQLAAELDDLPIVATNLPDAASRQVAAEYAGMSVSDEAGALRLFDQQWASLVVSPS